MRILICDNDPLITEQLEHLIRFYFKEHDLECPDINCYYNGNDLLNDTGDMDILFLDIEMPGINGILAGTELKKRHPNIIIFVVTSYAEYLDDAMRFHVFRYLSKPIDRHRFFRNLKEAIDLYYASIVKIPINLYILLLETMFLLSICSTGQKLFRRAVFSGLTVAISLTWSMFGFLPYNGLS